MEMSHVGNREVLRAEKKDPKTAVTDVTNSLHRVRVKVSQLDVHRKA